MNASGPREEMTHPLLTSWLAAVVIGLAGCSRDGRVDDKRAAADLADAPLQSSGNCDFDLTDAKAETVFYVLGTLNDYTGRAVVEGGDEVEHFYCNEGALIGEFRAALQRLSNEQGLSAYPEESHPQECFTFFKSQELAPLLNSCYRYEFKDDRWVSPANGRGRRRLAAGRFNFGLFYRDGGIDRVRARAYLSGAWRRWGRDRQFQFANSSEKAEGIAMLLSQLGCSAVSVEHTVGLIPGGWTVKFTPTPEVSGWLGRAHAPD